jgi:uncharacterized protein (TIGR03000 family)
LLINEKPTVSTGERRLFTTPALPPGKEFFYVLTAEAYRDGKAVTMTKEVTVSAATTSVVALKDLTPSQPRLPKISDVPPGTPKLVPPKVLAGK